MPTLVDEVATEREALLQYLAAQRGALHRAVHGLTDEQAAATPSASELSLGGLIRHLAKTERWWVTVVLAGQPDPDETPDQGFQLAEGDTLASLLADYEAVAKATEDYINAQPDLERSVPLPEAPWFPPGSKRSVRWVLLTLIQETARHAGHADIVRESLDGATAFGLIAAVHGY